LILSFAVPAFAQGKGPVEPPAVERARADAVQAFVKNAAPPPSASALQPLPRAQKTVKVVAAARELDAMAAVAGTGLMALELPADHVTDSMVPASALSSVEGALLVVPLRKGDPLLWQMLDDPDHPRSVMACMLTVRDAVRRARGEAPLPRGNEVAAASLRGIEIVVATQDLAAGGAPNFDVVTHLPDRDEATASVVRADSVVYVNGQRVYLPVLKGDVLLWSFFEVPNDRASVKACEAAVPPKGAAREQVAAARALATTAHRGVRRAPAP
jgi:hypothetical protein